MAPRPPKRAVVFSEQEEVFNTKQAGWGDRRISISSAYGAARRSSRSSLRTSRTSFTMIQNHSAAVASHRGNLAVQKAVPKFSGRTPSSAMLDASAQSAGVIRRSSRTLIFPSRRASSFLNSHAPILQGLSNDRKEVTRRFCAVAGFNSDNIRSHVDEKMQEREDELDETYEAFRWRPSTRSSVFRKVAAVCIDLDSHAAKHQQVPEGFDPWAEDAPAAPSGDLVWERLSRESGFTSAFKSMRAQKREQKQSRAHQAQAQGQGQGQGNTTAAVESKQQQQKLRQQKQQNADAAGYSKPGFGAAATLQRGLSRKPPPYRAGAASAPSAGAGAAQRQQARAAATTGGGSGTTAPATRRDQAAAAAAPAAAGPLTARAVRFSVVTPSQPPPPPATPGSGPSLSGASGTTAAAAKRVTIGLAVSSDGGDGIASGGSGGDEQLQGEEGGGAETFKHWLSHVRIMIDDLDSSVAQMKDTLARIRQRKSSVRPLAGIVGAAAASKSPHHRISIVLPAGRGGPRRSAAAGGNSAHSFSGASGSSATAIGAADAGSRLHMSSVMGADPAAAAQPSGCDGDDGTDEAEAEAEGAAAAGTARMERGKGGVPDPISDGAAASSAGSRSTAPTPPATPSRPVSRGAPTARRPPTRQQQQQQQGGAPSSPKRNHLLGQSNAASTRPDSPCASTSAESSRKQAQASLTTVSLTFGSKSAGSAGSVSPSMAAPTAVVLAAEAVNGSRSGSVSSASGARAGTPGRQERGQSRGGGPRSGMAGPAASAAPRDAAAAASLARPAAASADGTTLPAADVLPAAAVAGDKGFGPSGEGAAGADSAGIVSDPEVAASAVDMMSAMEHAGQDGEEGRPAAAAGTEAAGTEESAPWNTSASSAASSVDACPAASEAGTDGDDKQLDGDDSADALAGDDCEAGADGDNGTAADEVDGPHEEAAGDESALQWSGDAEDEEALSIISMDESEALELLAEMDALMYEELEESQQADEEAGRDEALSWVSGDEASHAYGQHANAAFLPGAAAGDGADGDEEGQPAWVHGRAALKNSFFLSPVSSPAASFLLLPAAVSSSSPSQHYPHSHTHGHGDSADHHEHQFQKEAGSGGSAATAAGARCGPASHSLSPLSELQRQFLAMYGHEHDADHGADDHSDQEQEGQEQEQGQEEEEEQRAGGADSCSGADANHGPSHHQPSSYAHCHPSQRRAGTAPSGANAAAAAAAAAAGDAAMHSAAGQQRVMYRLVPHRLGYRLQRVVAGQAYGTPVRVFAPPPRALPRPASVPSSEADTPIRHWTKLQQAQLDEGFDVSASALLRPKTAPVVSVPGSSMVPGLAPPLVSEPLSTMVSASFAAPWSPLTQLQQGCGLRAASIDGCSGSGSGDEDVPTGVRRHEHHPHAGDAIRHAHVPSSPSSLPSSPATGGGARAMRGLLKPLPQSTILCGAVGAWHRPFTPSGGSPSGLASLHAAAVKKGTWLLAEPSHHEEGLMAAAGGSSGSWADHLQNEFSPAGYYSAAAGIASLSPAAAGASVLGPQLGGAGSAAALTGPGTGGVCHGNDDDYDGIGGGDGAAVGLPLVESAPPTPTGLRSSALSTQLLQQSLLELDQQQQQQGSSPPLSPAAAAATVEDAVDAEDDAENAPAACDVGASRSSAGAVAAAAVGAPTHVGHGSSRAAACDDDGSLPLQHSPRASQDASGGHDNNGSSGRGSSGCTDDGDAGTPARFAPSSASPSQPPSQALLLTKNNSSSNSSRSLKLSPSLSSGGRGPLKGWSSKNVRSATEPIAITAQQQQGQDRRGPAALKLPSFGRDTACGQHDAADNAAGGGGTSSGPGTAAARTVAVAAAAAAPVRLQSLWTSASSKHGARGAAGSSAAWQSAPCSPTAAAASAAGGGGGGGYGLPPPSPTAGCGGTGSGGGAFAQQVLHGRAAPRGVRSMSPAAALMAGGGFVLQGSKLSQS